MEILGNAITNCDQITEICVLDSECKISQYADDTTLILDGSEKSMQLSFSLLDTFASISGLRINYEKTEKKETISKTIENWLFRRLTILGGNLNVTDAASLEIDDPFTKELTEIWSCLNFKKQPSDFSNIPIWYNSFVRINNKPIYYKNWYKAGILFRNHLLGENSHFLTFDAFKEKFSVKVNFLQYH